MANAPFDAVKELAEVKALREMQRRRRYRESKLERYRSELVALRRLGASDQDLVTWLRTKKRFKVDRSTVNRYLASLPELAPANQ